MSALLVAETETETGFEAGLQHLLLGDLRWLLDEPASAERSRWLLAVIDTLLVSRLRHVALSMTAPLGSAGGELYCLGDQFEAEWCDRSRFIDRLQRLRDRLVHGGPCGSLEYDLRLEATELLERRPSFAA